jgi:molybdopterin biosynthesis enzyme
MISVEEARDKILDAVSPLGLEKVNILEALGRVIGEDVYATRAIPPRDNSAMDGYTLRTEDTRGASPESPVRLDVIEEIPAGAIPAKAIGPGEAARIMTGALLRRDGDGYAVVTTGDEGSGILKSMVRANGLIVLPEESTVVGPGDLVTVQLIDDSLERGPLPEL